MPMLSISYNTVHVSKRGVAAFNSTWLGSGLINKVYWFQFDSDQNLVDTNVSEFDDGEAASALADDCKAYLFDKIRPSWMD